jgi:hypothetical protein
LPDLADGFRPLGFFFDSASTAPTSDNSTDSTELTTSATSASSSESTGDVLTFTSTGSSSSLFCSVLTSTNASLSAISPAISSINNKLQSTQSLLSQLDNLILGCLDENERQNYIVTQPLSSISNINNILDDQLQPNSNSPLGYKGYILTTEYDSSNTFSFPRRRIKASLATNPNNFILGPYSYSSSTQVLIDEIKFKIDQIVFNS